MTPYTQLVSDGVPRESQFHLRSAIYRKSDDGTMKVYVVERRIPQEALTLDNGGIKVAIIDKIAHQIITKLNSYIVYGVTVHRSISPKSKYIAYMFGDKEIRGNRIQDLLVQILETYNKDASPLGVVEVFKEYF